MPESAICNVRGIGVAVSVRTCISARKDLSRSLCCTPKRCSSSTIIMPRSENSIALASKACVPTTISHCPLASSSLVSFDSLAETKRESCRTLTGQPLKRSENVLKCCRERIVVGATIATCLPLIATAKAARKATSVFPNPTSPQMRRSIGLPLRRSPKTSSIAWS